MELPKTYPYDKEGRNGILRFIGWGRMVTLGIIATGTVPILALGVLNSPIC